MGRVLGRISAIIIGLVAGVLVYFQFVAPSSAPGASAARAAEPDVEILDETIVEEGDLQVSVSGTGQISPIAEVDLAFETSLPVREVLVEDGDRVSIGETLASLESIDLEAELEDAIVDLEAERVEYNAVLRPARDVDLAVLEAQLNAAYAAQIAANQGAEAEEIEIARIEAELARNQLWQRQIQRDIRLDLNPEFRDSDTNDAGTEQIQFDTELESAEFQVVIEDVEIQDVINTDPDDGAVSNAQADAIIAQTDLTDLEDGADNLELRQAEVRLQRAEVEVERAQTALDNAVITAPFDGVVAQTNITVGELPPNDAAAMVMLDTSNFYVDLEIDETDIVEVAVGQTTELTFDALPDATVPGTITRVDVTPSETGDDLVTYTVRVTIGETDEPIRTGMSATASIITTEFNDVVVVPSRFVRIDRSTGQAFATVAREDGQFEEVPVELGVRSGDLVQILSGLQLGQRIVQLPRETFDVFGN